MGQILRNDAVVSKHFKALRSGMELVLQPTEGEDCLGENDLLLSCRLVFIAIFVFVFFCFVSSPPPTVVTRRVGNQQKNKRSSC